MIRRTTASLIAFAMVTLVHRPMITVDFAHHGAPVAVVA